MSQPTNGRNKGRKIGGGGDVPISEYLHTCLFDDETKFRRWKYREWRALFDRGGGADGSLSFCGKQFHYLAIMDRQNRGAINLIPNGSRARLDRNTRRSRLLISICQPRGDEPTRDDFFKEKASSPKRTVSIRFKEVTGLREVGAC